MKCLYHPPSPSLQAALQTQLAHVQRHEDATTALAAATLAGFSTAAQAAALEQSEAKRAEESESLLCTLGVLKEVLAEKTAASAVDDAAMRGDINRLGAELQTLAGRVDALAQVGRGGERAAAA